MTVPPNAKEKVTLVVEESAAKLAKIRYWDVDLEIPAAATPKVIPVATVKKASAPAGSAKARLDFNPGY